MMTRNPESVRYHPLYGLWNSMKQRCFNPNTKDYKKYGGRGITVCKEWMQFRSFLRDMGSKPVGLCIDRIDNDGPYSKKNCRWATILEQSNNTRKNVRVEFDGKKLTYGEWDRLLGLSHGTTRSRILKSKWPIEKALKSNFINSTKGESK